ncbi:hypothetical protein HNR23_001440 [Nocardiopsis mwathae]|uniref:DUF3592 domain-containing protein n=1 Tax=Nocardiopsis mwathae TaxID=1472723 RepID=A0A7X0D4R4_9ACTN|nr:DUF3592 domain-containing protein [Nocardiopsis mwathae]MBB6171380.1 hypothetical protein [Nocardiopsis mwathae]
MNAQVWRTKGPLAEFFFLLILGAVLGFIGAMMVLSTMFNDYTDFTGRADAVVVNRVEERSSGSATNSGPSSARVYVAYAVDGREHTDVRLHGVNPAHYYEGDRLTIAYHPERPHQAVTVPSTEPGAFDILAYIGAGVLIAAVACLVGSGKCLARHRRQRATPPSHPDPSTDYPPPPAR